MVNALLAHMGGIDEIGIFVVPALLAIFALRWAEKRARERAAAEDEELSPLAAGFVPPPEGRGKVPPAEDRSPG